MARSPVTRRVAGPGVARHDPGVTRGEKVLAALALLSALGVGIAPWLLSSRLVGAIWPRLAVALAPCEPPDPSTPGPTRGADPWGRPWCRDRDHYMQVPWSAGPDGVDQGGAGDDLLPWDRPVECPAWPCLEASRWTSLAFALLLGWCLAAGRLLAAEPRGRISELLRGAFALLPHALLVTVGTLVLLGEPSAATSEQLVVPREVAVVGSALLALALLALVGWLLRRQAEEPAARDRLARRWSGLALVLAAIGALALGWVGTAERVTGRNIGVANARLRLIVRAQSLFRERSSEMRYGSPQELVASGLLPEHFVGTWRGYTVDAWVGTTAPEFLFGAVAVPTSATQPRRWFGYDHFAINQGGVVYFKRSPHAIDRAGCTLDPAAVCMSE